MENAPTIPIILLLLNWHYTYPPSNTQTGFHRVWFTVVLADTIVLGFVDSARIITLTE
jgi:hypothetical protein